MSYKAVSLISGGLDSLLATKVIADQGITVHGLYFFTGFTPHPATVPHLDKLKSGRLKQLSELLCVPIDVVDVMRDYRSVAFDPVYGYGSKGVNPCLDCKIFMVKQALQWMKQHEFDFIITGEVIGQRPMSQRRDTLDIVVRDSGAKDLLLRPLSAQCLKPTRPEIEGWVDREKLLAFNGRSRKPQMALAKTLGLENFSEPAGDCCFLLDAHFAERWKVFKNTHPEDEYTLEDIGLLRVGRHLRPKPHFEIVIGRDQEENQFLSRYRDQAIQIYTKNVIGPSGLIFGAVEAADIQLSASILAGFGRGRDQQVVEVVIEKVGESVPLILSVQPMNSSSIPNDWCI